MLVTGRILDDLRTVAADLGRFSAVVAEGGAVLVFPESGRSFLLAAPPSSALLNALVRAGVPTVAGQCVIEADAMHAARILELIRRLSLPLVIVFNRGRLMVLPQSISKATGLREALSALRLSPHNAIAIGDAENDHALLDACELGVACALGHLRAQGGGGRGRCGVGPWRGCSVHPGAGAADHGSPIVAYTAAACAARHLCRRPDCELAIRGRNVWWRRTRIGKVMGDGPPVSAPDPRSV